MSLSEKSIEINRLIKSFEKEADKFHNIEFHIQQFHKDKPIENRKYNKENHLIMLWQFLGHLNGDKNIKQFIENVNTSNLKWGIRGAELSSYGVIEGLATKKFVRMAKRAGTLFGENDKLKFQTRIINEIHSVELKKNPNCMPSGAVNSNPLSIWLNYLLYFLSKTHPSGEYTRRIEPDLFTLSLFALEQLSKELEIKKSDKSIMDVTKINFKVAVSFPGEKRKYVSRVVDVLREELGENQVFYDFDYQSQIARPNADILLQKIYHKQTELIVVFLCEKYNEKEWCGLEWRSVRDLIKSKKDNKIMFVKFDNAEIDGLFSIDGYINGNKFSTKKVAEFIMERLKLIN